MKLVYTGTQPRVLIGHGELVPGQEFEGSEDYLAHPMIVRVSMEATAELNGACDRRPAK